MGNWIKWMKNNNVYDNTMIIIVSDHGNTLNDNDIKLPEQLDDVKNLRNISSVQSLLLVKRFGSSGGVKIGHARVSPTDAPVIL